MKFGTQLWYEKLQNGVTKNQPHIAYLSIYYTPVYEVYRGYIVLFFPVCLCVCVFCVFVNFFFRQRFLRNYLT